MAARDRRRQSVDGVASDAQLKLKRKRDQASGTPRSSTKKVKFAQKEDVASLVDEQLRQENSRSLETSVEHEALNKTPPTHHGLNGTANALVHDTLPPSLLTPLQQKIEQQFSLEILIKHQELRLIEQELAKCQIALEQIRRCELIPYPASMSTQFSNEQVRTGSGLATVDAELAPAWGVMDGPYARHYSRWLLPDRRFDGLGMEDDMLYMRHESPVAGKTRPQRGNAGKLHALSNNYPAPKERNGPLLVRRSTDGQMVKLVCLDCHRGDFSSAQGFINHCRIAHHRSFDSHDAAAIECGQEVDADELSVPDRDVSSLVHPLIRQNLDDPENIQEVVLPVAKALPAKPMEPFLGLIRSEKTPYLSDFLQQRRIDLNLEELVADAGEQLAFSDSEDNEDEVEAEETKVVDDGFGARRMPFRSGMSPAPFRPSSKGSDSRGPSITTNDLDIEPTEHEFSPHMSESTTESNNAPSLVSDDEEDEYEHLSDASSHTTAESEDDVVDIAMEEEGEDPSVPKRTALRNNPGRIDDSSRMRLRKEDRHVTFVSPAPSASTRRSRRK